MAAVVAAIAASVGAGAFAERRLGEGLAGRLNRLVLTSICCPSSRSSASRGCT
jgi:hypothetical protein